MKTNDVRTTTVAATVIATGLNRDELDRYLANLCFLSHWFPAYLSRLRTKRSTTFSTSANTRMSELHAKTMMIKVGAK